MKKKDYSTRLLLRLRRNYEDHEIIATLYKKLSEYQIENGKLVSEVDEQNYIINKLQKEIEQLKQIKKEYLERKTQFTNRARECNWLIRENKKLNNQINELIGINLKSCV